MSLSVLLAGGGTAGHVSPLLAIADDLRFQDPDASIIVLGTEEGLESRLVPDAGYELVTIPKVPMPRRPNADALRFPGRFRGAVRSVVDLLRERDVDVVLGVGGYVSTPAYLAARRTGTPIVVHEANARPGMANRVGARLTRSDLVGYAFPGTPLKWRHVGMPMRAQIEAVDYDEPAQRRSARRSLGLDEEMPTLVVTGGSLGAQAINDAMAGSLTAIGSAGVQVLHITGAGKGEALREATADLAHYHVRDYVDGMENAYLAADLLVCRAGAGTVAEVSVVWVPAVFVPLAVGNGEQQLNAATHVGAGAAVMVDNADFSADYVVETVLPLVTDAERLGAMREAARREGFPGTAARTMTQMIHDAAGAHHPEREYGPDRWTKHERFYRSGEENA
ncbi:MAG: UDP-N-acetylglucosamine--N-acetylmuramyl-(pentapeptide) pyrophosphoryl-undecaprenol N-acetylglucosamine transferase [Brevibacterium yomogidense]